MKITPEEHQRRLGIYNKMYPQGATIKDMAPKMFINPAQVHKWIKISNLPYERKKGNRLSTKEQKRRMDCYLYCKKEGLDNVYLAKKLNLHTECIRKWIRNNELVQLNTNYTKIKLSPQYVLWDHKNGKIGNNKKKKSYVRHRPKWEKANIRHFATTLLTLNKKQYVSVPEVMKLCRKGN